MRSDLGSGLFLLYFLDYPLSLKFVLERSRIDRMKHYKRYRCLWALIVTLCVAACSMEMSLPQRPVDKDLVLLSTGDCRFPGDGGNGVISYLWAGEGVLDLEVETTRSWITITDATTYGRIEFVVDANETMGVRTGTILLKMHEKVLEKVFVTQEKMEPWIPNIVSGEYLGTTDAPVPHYRFLLSDKGLDNDGNLQADATYYQLNVYAKDPPADASMMLPRGTYKLDLQDSCAAGTVSFASSSYVQTDASGALLHERRFESLSLVVKEGSLVMEALDTEGIWHHVAYQGSYSLTDRSDSGNSDGVLSTLTEDCVVACEDWVVELEYYGDYYDNGLSNWYLKMMPENGTGEAIQVDFFVNDFGFEADFCGTYTATQALDVMTFFPGICVNDYYMGSWYVTLEDGEISDPKAPLASGSEMTILQNSETGTYTIRIQALDDAEEPHRIEVDWTGTLQVKSMI